VLPRTLLPLTLLLLPLVGSLASPDEPAEPEPVAVLDLARLEKGLPREWELRTSEGDVDVLTARDQAREGRSWVCVEGAQDERVLSLLCDGASFSLNRDVSDLDLDAHCMLEWEWKADALPAEADMREPRRNDQALQVLVQLDTSAKRVISYVWDTTAPVGTTGSESYAMGLYKVKVLCVQSGTEGLGDWHKLRRDLRADYKALYGSDDFPGVIGVRIQSNAQHTRSVASGAVRSLVFRPAGAPAAR